MLRRLQGSKFAALTVPRKGKPSCTISLGCFQPPTCQFKFRNSLLVMRPAFSAARPYITPTLSQVLRPAPVLSTPYTLRRSSQCVQRTAAMADCGS